MDLHVLLPSRFTFCKATAVAVDGAIISVGGWAFNTETDLSEAILWTYCPADFTSDGNLDAFDFLAFQSAFGNEDPAADLDHNSFFNLFDFLAFQTAYGNGC